MKKRVLILLTLLVTIVIGITAQQIGRRMMVNYGGEVIATYNLPQNIDSLTFETYNIYTVTATPSDENTGRAEASATEVEEGNSVTLTATPNDGYRFVNWTVNGEVVSISNPYIATITQNTQYIATFEKSNIENVHVYVDLGLSVKWATCNVGATSPEDYGDYFAWGETEPKDYYDWSTYKYCYVLYTSMTKYCTDSEYGIVDNKTVLELEDDAARVNWGGNWRMPTKAEYDELMNTTNCTWTWTTQNGVKGYKVTSKKNGNSIFLPVTGYRNKGDLRNAGSTGDYWSSSLYASNSVDAYNVGFNSSGVDWYDGNRYDGLSVRAVCETSTPIVCTVSVSSTEGGTATASANSVEAGGSVTLTATRNEGYSFVNWTVDGKEVSTSVTYTATITANTEFKANFISYKVTVVSGEGGTATANKIQVGYNGQVTLTATPNEGYSFVNWTVNGEEVSTKNPYTATITANTEFKANFRPLRGVENSHEWIDLGLPSGLKWATCNIGANSPEEYGDYFAWGDTEPKDYYYWDSYKYCNGSSTTMTKYCTSSSYGKVDNKTTLELTDDAARVNWAGSWRIPTRAEYDELMNTTNCTWTWTTQNGVKGCKVTSKKNGNSIFLPAAGFRGDDNLDGAGSSGYYWSSSLCSGGDNAYNVVLYSGDVYLYDGYRYFGQSVRAVCE